VPPASSKPRRFTPTTIYWNLDGQLFQQFCSAKDLLKQTPEQAESREQLRDMLASRKSGGIIFTTVQKFSLEDGETAHPSLCDRTNVVVISDEAHRSQYGMKAKLNKKTGNYTFGFAKHMRDALPQASFIGFTGTPIEKDDANTKATFGDYVSIYDIEDAKNDKATVPIYYESRLAKLDINREEIDRLNKDVEEVIEDEEDVAARENTKGKWAELAKLVGAKERVQEIAADLVAHYETRTSVLEGKAMIVAMSRDICVSLFDEIIALRPEWAGMKLSKDGKTNGWNHEDGAIRIVMTGTASDKAGIQDHVYSKGQKKRLEKRFKDSKDPLKLVIVRDMWLTGFDAPCCHTMYVDKPMAGHNLMQAIARVILDNAVKAEDVQDIFQMAGLEKPNIGLLSDEFLEDVRRMERKNLAVELLERLLQDKIRSQTKTNLVQEKKYSDRLLEALRKYHNRMIESSQVIAEMIEMAKDMQAAMQRHEELGLNPDEEAFYDALADRPEVLLSMGDATLKKLASELTEKLRNSTTVDWQFRESVRAKMRILIKHLLRKYKYPPEGQEAAVALVLKQAEALADDWTTG
jgi:type I restriction enzyme R subunit